MAGRVTPLAQAVVAVAVLASATVASALGKINGDALVAIYSATLGYVFGIGGAGVGSHIANTSIQNGGSKSATTTEDQKSE